MENQQQMPPPWEVLISQNNLQALRQWAVTASPSDRDRALSYVVQLGRWPMLRLLVERGVDLNKPRNNRGHTLLYQVIVGHGRRQDVDYLVEKGANIDLPSFANARSPGKTNVHACLKYRQLPLLRRLMHHEIDVNVLEKGGSPLRVAMSRYARAPASQKTYYKNIVKTLLEYNVDFDFHDYHDPTWMDPQEPVPHALVRMVERCRWRQSLAFLVSDEQVDLDDTDAWGKTALHRAVENGQYEQAKRLVEEYWTDWDIPDHWGHVAYFRALQRQKHYEWVLKQTPPRNTPWPRHLVEQKMRSIKRIAKMLLERMNLVDHQASAF